MTQHFLKFVNFKTHYKISNNKTVVIFVFDFGSCRPIRDCSYLPLRLLATATPL